MDSPTLQHVNEDDYACWTANLDLDIMDGWDLDVNSEDELSDEGVFRDEDKFWVDLTL